MLTCGELLGNYKIVSQIGLGGMSEVYLACDTRTGREWALKVLNERFRENLEALTRFKREYEVIASIDHPAIVKVYEFSAQVELAYIAMELLKGKTLREKLEVGPLAWQEALEIALQVAEGLAAAHNKGVVHRDLKPENIFLTEDGAVKLLDFGLARVEPCKPAQSEPSSFPTLQKTTPGMLMGTMPYMSPEQLRGEPVDERADIFSFGCVLYEMLSGRGPFQADTAPETMAAILKDTPAKLAGVPRKLERIVIKCLEKSADERYPTVKQLIESLQDVQDGDDTTLPVINASQEQKAKRAWTWWIIFCALAVMAGLLLLLVDRARIGIDKGRFSIAVIDVINETGERELDGLSGLITTDLEQSRNLEVVTRASMFDAMRHLGLNAERVDEVTGKKICKEAGVRLLLISAVRKFGQLYSLDMKILDLAKDEYIYAGKAEGKGIESVPGLIDRLTSEVRIKLADGEITKRSVAEFATSNMEAYQHYFQGEQYLNSLRWEDAEREYRRALELDPSFVLAYYRLAYVLEWFGDPSTAEVVNKAFGHIDRMPIKERYMIMSLKARTEGDLDGSLGYLLELLKIFPNDKEVLWNVGDRLFHAGEYQSSIDYLKRVLAMDPTFELALNHLAWAYETIGDYASSAEVAEKWVSLKPSDQAYNCLGMALCLMGQLQQAKQVYERAERLYPTSDLIKSGLADVYLYGEEYEAVGEMLTAELATSSSTKQQLLRCLARRAALLGKYREALKLYEQVVQMELEKDNKKQLARALTEQAFWFYAAERKELAALAISKAEQFEDVADWYYHVYRHVVLLLMGNYEEAARSGKIVAMARPLRPVTIEAFRALSSKDYDLAIPLLRQIYDRGYVEDKVFFGYFLAQAYYDTGRLLEAEEVLKKLLTINYNKFGYRAYVYPRALLLLGRTAEALVKRDQAQAAYAKLLTLWKDADSELTLLKKAKERFSELSSLR
ncbi:MAG: protein kinase [Acidobacteriota bacterium]|nr:protein kinase [Blastocatellia bacterium]MDW8411979.1 protein kinase [Acidobacteriota bacterium]